MTKTPSEKFEFVGSCVELDGDLIGWVRGRQRDIGGPKPDDLDFEDFAKLVPASQFQHEGLNDDWHVRFYASSAPSGVPLLYYAHSGIEWVFAPRSSGFDPGMEADAVARKLDEKYSPDENPDVRKNPPSSEPHPGSPLDNPAFRRWFGDSVVADEEGEPLVVYHGTASNFSVFRSDRIGEVTDAGTLGAGFYFTTLMDAAQSYAVAAAEKTGGQPKIIHAYLRIENPWPAPRRIWQLGSDPKAAKKHSTSLKKQGFDGVFFHIDQSVLNAPSFDEFVVFDPRQIKSATDNDGSFDPENPDVRKNPPRRDAMTVEAGNARIEVHQDAQGLHATLDGERVADVLLFESLKQLNKHVRERGKFSPILEDVEGSVAYFSLIEIPESSRGKGLGTAIAERVLLAIQEMGLDAVVLHAHHPWLHESMPQWHFWYSLGFLPLRYNDSFYGPAMGLQLTKGSIPRLVSAKTGVTPNSGRTFIPPQKVADEAAYGLYLRSQMPPSNRCCTAVGLARAKQLKNRQPVSVETLKRMRSYFQRHAVDKKGSRWAIDSKGFQAWLLWGGDSGRDWCNRTLDQLRE